MRTSRLLLVMVVGGSAIWFVFVLPMWIGVLLFGGGWVSFLAGLVGVFVCGSVAAEVAKRVRKMGKASDG